MKLKRKTVFCTAENGVYYCAAGMHKALESHGERPVLILGSKVL